MWDPTSYLRYGDERSRPFYDLLARVGAERPRTVVDLGCGPGNLTLTLAERWPGARVVGLDSSPEMIEAATAARRSGGTAPEAARVEFAVGDARDWSPGPDVDVVISNAMLQWVPGHDALLRRWARELPAGAWLAFQLPGNFGAPSHQALRTLANEPRWRDVVAPVLRPGPAGGEVGDDPVGYAALLADAGCRVDAWETTYVHLLPVDDGAAHPVLSWLEGTALRPVRAVLGGGAAWDDFRAALGERLATAYPARNGWVYFPFRRIFVVARTGARPQGETS
ncbi:trans-aconitate 2-methyltransferase [Micromonospora sp. HM5-17]|jgi:trans-aconitate 2-methyltransferase|uniref:trans-aconitate 2-methyltransferase n=1 Tax=Micromonospora sp. HM5-17 TaxID=2487710 RepID=UPI000F47D01A|nr:trans-aconitate 2-methyltransferase [Micromonospora sp. HM5-17]ROT33248.1 trans-aconitate 2-methyltransferase [Micromonospora sp. HM5-17]